MKRAIAFSGKGEFLPSARRFFPGILLLCVTLLPGIAAAATINGSIEWTYTKGDLRSDTTSGLSTRQDLEAFRQRYNLYLIAPLYPKLSIRAGGAFERTATGTETDGEHGDTTNTRLNPLVELTLGDRLFGLGAGYYRNEESAKSSNGPTLTNIRDTYNSFFAWRPVDLPTLDVGYTRTYLYDKDRLFRDNVNDLLSVQTIYTPSERLRLTYKFSYNDSEDRLKGLVVTGQTHSGRVEFNENYLANRAILNGTYNISFGTTETSAQGTGDVAFQRSPISGLFSFNDTPADARLDPNPSLIDGNLAASAGIDIGQRPSFLGDTRQRNMGLDFGFDTKVNTLYVWVDNNVAAVAGFYSWGVYTSRDNQTWTLLQTVSSAPFGPFDNRFEIRFATVTTRYIKLVTRPLPVSVPSPPGVDISNVFVTEIQAFQNLPAEEVRGRTHSTAQIADLGVRVMLLDHPSIFYDFYTVYTRSDPGGFSTYDVTNGLTYSQQFSRVFSGTARVAREDQGDGNTGLVNYQYSASVTAVPLPTLTHTFLYSGRKEHREGKSSDSNSFVLNNYARLYTGIDVSLLGGVSFQNTETDQKVDSGFVTLGTTINPRPELTLGVSYNGTKTTQSGGGKEDSKTSQRTAEANISYQPFRNLYMYATISRFSQAGQPDTTTKNFNLNYSPFQGGALQFNLQYFEGIRSPGDERDRNVTPSLRWRINPRAFADVSYQIARNSSSLQTSRSDTFTASLRMYFQ